MVSRVKGRRLLQFTSSSRLRVALQGVGGGEGVLGDEYLQSMYRIEKLPVGGSAGKGMF